MATESNSRITWEGCSVLLDINDGDRLCLACLSPNASIKIGNKKCSLNPLIGRPFGSSFRLETGTDGAPHLALCVPSSSSSSSDATRDLEKDDWQSKDEAKDNRELLDNNTAQSLSREDIDAMRCEGATGDEIVDALIANSSTFGKKTAFSQEKYKLKKQKKYAPKVLLRRPFARSICEAYFKKYPTRIGFLRVDTLSLLLSMGNIGAYSDVLVVDMVGGMLAGAVAERLGGSGHVCSTYFGTKPPSLDIVRIFNFSNEVCRRILQAPFSVFSLSQNNGAVSFEKDPNVQSLELHYNACNASLLPCSSDGVDDTHQNTSSLVQKPVPAGRQASSEDIKSWKEKGFTSLIVAAPEMDVGSIIEDLLPLLSYSAPFAIYHQYLQPLATCMHKLQTSKMAINLQISEPWLREYQVLPSRTHPHMQMSGFGGYILSGTKISGTDSCNGN
ncbi:tRNA (adenine(58)-N(1))-methyltransferase non-catalytic subunit trm6 [Asparagus officinalis]|uniref:tRNA (adenine(58)-N(1))-methyltransferase non-catalytic subunit trm6 n=1 Tax=Asparagus officinalis TaxID=4686 RepID=UPI00098E6613|nr:tRNA (adenine(58)-N(1))-methyltransferase non-catalytic subunit trm6 [Asparagus officinalis]